MNFDNVEKNKIDFINDSFLPNTWKIVGSIFKGAEKLLPKDGEKVIEYCDRIHSNKNWSGLQIVLKKYPLWWV